MAGATKAVTIGDQTFTVRRPSKKQMESVALKLERLLFDMSKAELLRSSLLAEMLLEVTEETEALQTLIDDGDPGDVMKLWEEYKTFGRFEELFGTAEERKEAQEKQTARLKQQQEENQAMVKQILELGLEGDQIMDLVRAANPQIFDTLLEEGLNATSTATKPNSSTSSPRSTAGVESN